MTLKPTPITAALAGAFSGLVMPALWPRLADDNGLFLAGVFLLCVALPAHAFVVGFGPGGAASGRSVDKALLQRIGAWLASAAVTALVVRSLLL